MGRGGDSSETQQPVRLGYREGEILRSIHMSERLGFEPTLNAITRREGVSTSVIASGFRFLHDRGLIEAVDPKVALGGDTHWRVTAAGRAFVPSP